METFKAGNLFSGRAATWGRPYRGKQTGSVGSAKPGAEDEPQRRQFLQTQGPVARNETIKATQILRAGNSLHTYRYASPVMGDRGKATMSTKCPSAASPAALCQSLVTPGEAQRSGFAGKRRSKGTNAVFAARRKRSGVDFATTSRRGQSHSPPAGGEISLCTTSSIRILPPSSVWPSASHLPPGGRLREKRRNTVSHKILLPTFLLRKVGGGDHPRTDLKFSSTAKAA